MTPFSPFGMPQFDPSKMNPKLMMEISELVRKLPPEQLQKMQTIMHNSMAGLDVRREMEEFEKTLPPGFREKLMGIMAGQFTAEANTPASPSSTSSAEIEVEASTVQSADSSEMNLHSARITLLQAVADGRMSPEEAERLLFPS